MESPLESATARRMARFYFASFWMIIFTGSIRKWMFPGASILYLLQDVPMGLAYVYALWTGFFNRSYLMMSVLLLCSVLVLQGILQVVVSGLSPIVALVGMHNYLFYLPFLFIFPLCLNEKYRRNFVWWNLMLSIPMCLLAIAQSQAPKQAFINRTSEGDAFGLPGAEVARVSGTFNFTVFYGVWVGLCVALCMGEWLTPKHKRCFKKPWMLILVTFTCNVCHLVSASRSAIALAAAGVFGAMVAAMVLRSTRSILAIAGICALMPVAAGMTYVVSPAEFNIIVDRFTGDQYVDDGKTRLEGGIIGFLTIPKFSFLGAGIGMGVDAAHFGNADTYNFTYTLSEGDTIRNVMELGTPVGLLYVFLRIGFMIGMVLLSIRIVRSGSSPHCLPLSFFLLAQGYQGDLTRAATMTGSQVMVGYAFILGVYYHPDADNYESETGESIMRYA